MGSNYWKFQDLLSFQILNSSSILIKSKRVFPLFFSNSIAISISLPFLCLPLTNDPKTAMKTISFSWHILIKFSFKPFLLNFFGKFWISILKLKDYIKTDKHKSFPHKFFWYLNSLTQSFSKSSLSLTFGCLWCWALNDFKVRYTFKLTNSYVKFLMVMLYLFSMPYRKFEGFTKALNRLICKLPSVDYSGLFQC